MALASRFHHGNEVLREQGTDIGHPVYFYFFCFSLYGMSSFVRSRYSVPQYTIIFTTLKKLFRHSTKIDGTLYFLAFSINQ